MTTTETRAAALAQLTALQDTTGGAKLSRVVYDRHGQAMLIATRGTKLQSLPTLGDFLITECVHSRVAPTGILSGAPATLHFCCGEASMSVETGEWLFLGDDECRYATAGAAYAALEAGRK